MPDGDKQKEQGCEGTIRKNKMSIEEAFHFLSTALKRSE